MPRLRRTRSPRVGARAAAALLLALTLLRCSGDGGTGPDPGPDPGPRPPASLSKTDGDGQTAPAGADLPVAPRVVVRDAGGSPVPGVAVAFAVTAGGGAVTGAAATTGADGTAAPAGWRLGTAAGANTLQAAVAGLSPVDFTATAVAGPAAALAAPGGTAVAGPAGTQLSLAVVAQDAHGNPVGGATVAFSLTSGAGTLAAPSAVSGGDGRAAVGFTATAVGASTVAAALQGAGGPPVTFTVTAGAEGLSLAAVPPVAREGFVGQRLAVRVRVTGAGGTPVAGVAVGFVPSAGGGAAAPAATATDAAGEAQAWWTLPLAAGAHTLTASAAGQSAVFTASARAVLLQASEPTTILGTPGGMVGVAVRATAGGSPAEGVPVDFTLSVGGGVIDAASDTTDPLGRAGIRWTLPEASGEHTVTASAAGQQVVFTARLGPRLRVVFGGGFIGLPGTRTFPGPTVRVEQANGQPVSGVPVTFTVTAGGGGVAPDLTRPYTGSTTVASDGLGHASASFRLGPSPGLNTLTMTAPGYASATLTDTAALAGPPARVVRVSGNDQRIPAGNALPLALLVRVEDARGVPVGGSPVTFSVTAGGGTLREIVNDVPRKVTARTVVSDTAGHAATPFETPDRPDVSTVRAAVAGIDPVTFTATATALSQCAGITEYVVGTAINAQLTFSDCPELYQSNGFIWYSKPFRFALEASRAVHFQLATTWASHLMLMDAEHMVAEQVTLSPPARLLLLLAPGTYYPGVSSNRSGTSGAFTLSSTVLADVTSCGLAQGMRGVAVTLRLQSTDCTRTVGGSVQLYDRILLPLRRGETVTVEMTSGEVDAYLALYTDNLAFPALTDDDGAGGTHARITYTAPYDLEVFIDAATSPRVTGQTGAYTLSIR
ncbi:MAG TPA: Ig-like domain-containing protein [Longimicrobium sp.]